MKVNFNLITEPALDVVGYLYLIFVFCFIHFCIYIFIILFVFTHCPKFDVSFLIFSFCIINQRFVRIHISFHLLLLHPQGLICSIFMIIYS